MFWVCVLLLVILSDISLSTPLSLAPSRVFRNPGDSSTKNESTTETPTLVEQIEERKPIEEPEIPSNFKIDFVNDNGTDIVAPRRTIFEVIPVDYICDFCLNVIDKLKIRQQIEKDFQENIKEECWKYNETVHDDGTICELVNRANLDRLRNDKSSVICMEEHFCDDTRKDDEEKKVEKSRYNKPNLEYKKEY